MSDFFLGEIRLFGFDYAPENWHVCDGSLLQIKGNEALYSLIGTTFGGDAKTTFALPDFRGRVPVASTFTPATVPQGATRYLTVQSGKCVTQFSCFEIFDSARLLRNVGSVLRRTFARPSGNGNAGNTIARFQKCNYCFSERRCFARQYNASIVHHVRSAPSF